MFGLKHQIHKNRESGTDPQYGRSNGGVVTAELRMFPR